MINGQKLSNEELFQATLDLPKEIFKRIVNGLEKRNISVYYFTDNPDICITDDDANSKGIKIYAVGFLTEESKLKNVFVLDNNNQIYFEESICQDIVGDLYKILLECE